MKKILLSLGVVLMSTAAVMAQKKKAVAPAPAAAPAPAVAPAAAAPAAPAAEAINFKTDSHSFGTVSEGGAADYEFSFTNTSSKPIIIQRVQPSCGCTIPTYSKEPVAPGASGTVKASYGTQGRPGEFHKTLTVFYLVGDDTNPQSKVLQIMGTVEKAPTSSVPENNSMMKTN